MFEVKLDKQPEHFLSKCEDEIFERISKKLENLQGNLVPHDSKKIRGYELDSLLNKIKLNYSWN